MDNPSTNLHQRKATKKAKPKKKPIKVVYISNPMKVKTSASQFMALVQELTGQDAESPADPTRFIDVDADAHQTVPDASKMVDELALAEVPTVERADVDHLPSEPFDDFLTPQMIENFSGFLPSSFYYDSSQDDVLKSLDAM